MSAQVSLPLRLAVPMLAHRAPEEDRSIMFRQSAPMDRFFRIGSPLRPAFVTVAVA